MGVLVTVVGVHGRPWYSSSSSSTCLAISWILSLRPRLFMVSLWSWDRLYL